MFSWCVALNYIENNDIKAKLEIISCANIARKYSYADFAFICLGQIIDIQAV